MVTAKPNYPLSDNPLPGSQQHTTAIEDEPIWKNVSITNSSLSATGPSALGRCNSTIFLRSAHSPFPSKSYFKWSPSPFTSGHLISTHSQKMTPDSLLKERRESIRDNNLIFLIINTYVFPVPFSLFSYCKSRANSSTKTNFSPMLWSLTILILSEIILCSLLLFTEYSIFVSHLRNFHCTIHH